MAKAKGRGGRRPGAGALRGNLNALKTGTYSKQFVALGSFFVVGCTGSAILESTGNLNSENAKTKCLSQAATKCHFPLTNRFGHPLSFHHAEADRAEDPHRQGHRLAQRREVRNLLRVPRPP